MTSEARGDQSPTIESALAAVGMAAIAIAVVVTAMYSVSRVTSGDAIARIVAYGFFAAVDVAWLGLFVKLLAIKGGRRYLGEPAVVQLGFYMAGRAENLIIAGLVLAALTLGNPNPDAASLLTIALASLLVVFATSSWVGRKSSDLVGTAVHWIGMAALVAGVSLVPATATTVGRTALLFGGAAIAIYSIVDLRSRHSDAFPGAGPPPTASSDPTTRPQA
ncbi:MAG TPA: hypothetical protein VES62_07355 [Thermoleophilaceae bacterium]|nr:hypothetical protein [Thermoleophilaceae bacterium]